MKLNPLFLKSIYCFALGLFAISLNAVSASIDTEHAEKTISPHQFEMTPEIFVYSYKEQVDKKPFMSLNGPMYGLSGAYTYNFGKNFMKFAPRVAGGSLKYKSNGTGRMNNDPSWYVEFQALYGRHFDVNSNVTISPYLGLGYRYLENDTSKKRSTTGAYGYLRESEYLFLPIGADLTIPFDAKLSFVANAEYDLFLKGMQKSHMPVYKGIGGLMKNKQSKGYGLRTAAGLRWTLEKMFIEAKPFFRYWSIASSKKVHQVIQTRKYTATYTFSEPKNQTKEVGLGITFKF